MDPTKERLLGWLIYGGCGLFVIGLGGLLLTLLFSFGVMMGASGEGPVGNVIVGFTIFCLVGGIVAGVTGLVVGHVFNARIHSGPRSTLPHAFIVGKFALDEDQNPVISTWEWTERDDLRFFVRMRTDRQRVSEYECHKDVFFLCGEGMTGQAEVQGRWLGRFTPYIGPGVSTGPGVPGPRLPGQP